MTSSQLHALSEMLRYATGTRAHISRDPKAFQFQRAESKLTYYTTIGGY